MHSIHILISHLYTSSSSVLLRQSSTVTVLYIAYFHLFWLQTIQSRLYNHTLTFLRTLSAIILSYHTQVSHPPLSQQNISYHLPLSPHTKRTSRTRSLITLHPNWFPLLADVHSHLYLGKQNRANKKRERKEKKKKRKKGKGKAKGKGKKKKVRKRKKRKKSSA